MKRFSCLDVQYTKNIERFKRIEAYIFKAILSFISFKYTFYVMYRAVENVEHQTCIYTSVYGNCVNQYLSTLLVFLLLFLKLCFNNIDKKTIALLNNVELICVSSCECKVGRHKVCLQNDEGKKLFVGQEEG